MRPLRVRSCRAVLTAAVSLLGLAGCRDGDDRVVVDAGLADTGIDIPWGADQSEPDAGVMITGFRLTQNPVNVLSYFAEWETSDPSSTRLDVTCGPDYGETFTDAETRVEHAVFVMGLVGGTTCTFTATAESDLGSVSESSTVTVDDVPEVFPTLNVTVSEAELVQSGWTLFNLHNGPRGEPPSVVMVDENGEYRWYYRVPTTDTGLDNDVRTVPEGVLMQVPPRIVDWEGGVVWERDLPMHHDVRPYGEEGHLLFLSVADCPAAQPPADVVVEYDRHEDRAVWEWRICEHYTPPEVFPDWSHLNTVVPFPGENALLVSSRHQHALFKIDRSTDDVAWRLGFDGDFQMAQTDLFYNPHSPEIQSNGNILLFDNGSEERRYSRAIELAYTDSGDDWEARVVWEYAPDPPIFCFSWGDADRLENGNTLISFGVENPGDGVSHLIEVTSDNPGRKVWDLMFPRGWAMYRAERVVNPVRGYVIRGR